MATDISTAAPTAKPQSRTPPVAAELSILGVMIGMMLLFEVLGWIFVGQSFIINPLRLKIMILQEAEIGIIAVGVTQVIIMGGIDLSSGSLVGMTAMIAASLAQTAGFTHAIYPSLTGLNPIFPVAAGLACGLIVGLVNGWLIAFTKIPPFIATLGMMVSARGVADWYTNGQPIGNLSDHSPPSALAGGRLSSSSVSPSFSTSRCATRAMASSPTRSALTRSRRVSPASTSSAT